VDSSDWAIQRVDECIVGCRCRFCPDRNLGLYAIGLTPQQAPRINHASYRKWIAAIKSVIFHKTIRVAGAGGVAQKT
jgi:hypothetical protein